MMKGSVDGCKRILAFEFGYRGITNMFWRCVKSTTKTYTILQISITTNTQLYLYTNKLENLEEMV